VSKSKSRYPRFSTGQRIEHALLIISFTVLAITGLPQKFPDTSWGNMMIQLMGGIEITRLIHRAAAILLMLATIYHGAVVTYKVAVLHLPLTILPSWQDMKDGFHAFGHNLGLVKKGPQMGRYTFGEKAEYWAVIWGTVIMIITGFMLWNPIATAQFLPGQFIPAAKATHGGEALLAVLSILTWHFYSVHLRVLNKSMFTGFISRHEMEEEHPLELADIAAGQTVPRIDPAVLQRRQRIFIPIAAVITVVLLTGLYVFVTFEQTAIDTVPRQEIEVFTPAPGP
jgi:cytochrome b subunit of formate dehydrogenase